MHNVANAANGKCQLWHFHKRGVYEYFWFDDKSFIVQQGHNQNICTKERLLFQITWLLSSSGRVGGPGREQTEGEAEVNRVFTSPAWSFSSVSSWSCICKEICQDKASQRQTPIKINYTTLGFSSKLHCSTTNSAAKKIMNKRVYKDTKLKQMSV